MKQIEVRLAVVLYGGVSLAVYIHGVTREILNLVRASKRGWVTTFYGSPRPGYPPGIRVALENSGKAAIEMGACDFIMPDLARIGILVAGKVDVRRMGRPILERAASPVWSYAFVLPPLRCLIVRAQASSTVVDDHFGGLPRLLAEHDRAQPDEERGAHGDARQPRLLRQAEEGEVQVLLPPGEPLDRRAVEREHALHERLRNFVPGVRADLDAVLRRGASLALHLVAALAAPDAFGAVRRAWAGALTLIVWQSLGAAIDFSVVRAVTVLVIACPHALGLAVPLVVAISTTLAAQGGLLVRDRRGLEEARNLHTVIFDKTGTLTLGEFRVVDMTVAEGVGEEEALRIAERFAFGIHVFGRGQEIKHRFLRSIAAEMIVQLKRKPQPIHIPVALITILVLRDSHSFAECLLRRDRELGINRNRDVRHHVAEQVDGRRTRVPCARQGLHGDRSDEALGRPGHHDLHRCPFLDEGAAELGGLVAGNAPGEAQDNVFSVQVHGWRSARARARDERSWDGAM